MCKSRKSTDSLEPKAVAKSSSRAPINSSSKSSASTFFTTTSSFHNTSTSSPSSSSRSSSAISTHLKLKHHLFSPHTPNPTIYPFSELSSATSNFHHRRLSPSPSSSSWRCSLRGHEAVIFRRKLRCDTDLSELRARFSAISKSHHTSIAKLLGVSLSESYVYVVYEYVKGASLCDCLRNKVNRDYTVLSSWVSRMQVATDVAHGLEYIHHCAGKAGSGFVHNRIKSSSIVVEEDSSTSKICHFGTAQLCGEVPVEEDPAPPTPPLPLTSSAPVDADIGPKPTKKANSCAMKFEGTMGYMSPEFRSTGVPTRQSDVYAFGVVILELLSGLEPLTFRLDKEGGVFERRSLIDEAREVVADEGRVRRWVDSRLKDSFPVQVAARMVRLGLECVHDDPDRRPDLGQVAGLVSKLYLESKKWSQRFALPEGFSVSMAPR